MDCWIPWTSSGITLRQGSDYIDIIGTLRRGPRGPTVPLWVGLVLFARGVRCELDRGKIVKSPSLPAPKHLPTPRPPLGRGHGISRLLERLVANRHFLEPCLLAPFLLLRAHTHQCAPVAVASVCRGIGHALCSIASSYAAQLTPGTVSTRLTRQLAPA